MKVPLPRLILLIAIGAGVFWFIYASCRPILEGWRFMMRSQNYYSKVAAACDALIAEGKPTPREIRQAGLEALPPVLRHLHPYCVVVDTNAVMVRVGAGINAYRVFWCQNEIDPARWELKVSRSDDLSRSIVFSRATGERSASHPSGPTNSLSKP